MESIEKLIAPHGLHKLTPRWIKKSIETSFYPERANINFQRFLEEAISIDPALLQRFNKRNIPWMGLLFSGSQLLSDLVMKDPESLFWALDESVLHSTRFKAEMRHERDKTLAESGLDPKDALCVFKNRELLRVGWRDLLKWADTVETLEDLSRLADVSLEGALTIAESEMTSRYGRPVLADGTPGQFLVLGLGKLGGRELNFSSDIDLIYFYNSDDGKTEGGPGPKHLERPSISLQEYYTKVAQKMTSILNDVGSYGYVYRVDLDLRPEGSRGPITAPLSAASLYYESWGQPWERQMLIKARAVAGSPDLADRFFKLIRPFVYRKYLDYSHLREIQVMKEKIDQHLRKGKNKYKNNVKLGKGGIREIEFIIQAYQLIYGGKMPWLAEQNSIKALHRIFERGLLGPSEYAELSDALLFLRDLENRMQIAYGRQVQILPTKDDELEALALKMNMVDKDHLLKVYNRITDDVHNIFTEFFKQEEDQVEEELGDYAIDLDNEDEAVSSLDDMGFENPKKALATLVHIRDGEPFNHPSTKSRRMFARLMPQLLEKISLTPDKNRVLDNLDKFFSVNLQREGIYEVLLELPSSQEVLATLFSMAQSLADVMVNLPGATEILAEGTKVKPHHSLAEIPPSLEGYDERLSWLRRERNSESMRIGINYLFNHRNPITLMEELTDLAGEYVDGCVRILQEEYRLDGELPDARFAVIGLGKVGRRELNYGSDLDLIFVFEHADGGNALENNQFYIGFCRKLLNIVGGISHHGVAYKVDTRLRPEGEKGPIVMSDKASHEYYRKRGALWERMALSSARVIGGDREFGQKFLEDLQDFVFGTGLSDEEKEMISKMKRKIEMEKVKNPDRIPFKYGKGGVVDIEFFAQQLKLEYGHKEKDVRTLNTLGVLERAAEEGWGLESREDIRSIIESYRFIRLVETHIRMESGLSTEALPKSKEKLELLDRKVRRFANYEGNLPMALKHEMKGVRKSLEKAIPL